MKRVKKVTASNPIDGGDCKGKRKRPNVSLLVLVCRLDVWEGIKDEIKGTLEKKIYKATGGTGIWRVVDVPALPPVTMGLLRKMDQVWPQIWHSAQSWEQREREMNLGEGEGGRICKWGREVGGGDVWIVDPSKDVVVSKGSEEGKLQGGANNVLQTNVILAIQGVARRERSGNEGQYICTGYEIYMEREPDWYEAMALLHARVGKVVFKVWDEEEGGVGGMGNGVQDLEDTNHRYRVFKIGGGTDGDFRFSIR